MVPGSVLLSGVLLISAIGSTPVYADDAPPSGYPSWQDVQNSKQNAAATARQISNITKLLGDLQNQAAVLGDAAVSASADYGRTKLALDAATSKTEMLTGQLQQSQQQSGKLKTEAGALAAISYKTGGTSLGFLSALSELQSPGGLGRIDLINALTSNAAHLYARADQAQKVASALQSQQQAAEQEQQSLTDEAKTKLDAAVSAQQAAEAEVAKNQANSNTLKQQLASLNNTTADLENKYQQGVAAQAAYEAAQEAKRKAAEEEAQRQQAAQQAAANAARPPAGGGGGYIPPDVLLPNIPGGGVNDPAGAQAYASANLGVFGWGQDQMGCLVQLWTQESSWLTNATNPSSGAYGIAQSLPPSKMYDAGSDWLTNYRTQINWGLNYIKGRYGSPCGAWAHEVAIGWY
ncbi:transglycosylase [Psychromicrobium sp. YIM B11713]|uniref:aggregation-promoting factor C-terminal-like domain-containing protein n=1 Tax=Psychromicrobium sp. YIM B11713 TaxID=3145233 RepID=UPI00374FA2F4